MDLIQLIVEYLKVVLQSFKQGMCKHDNYKILTRYDEYERMKNFKGNDLKKLRISPTYKEMIQPVKCVCLDCRTVFLSKCRRPVWPRQ